MHARIACKKRIEMNVCFANTCITMRGSVTYFRATCALKCMVELQRHVLGIQGRVTYCRGRSALTCMSELQILALECNAVLHTSVKEVHWDA